MKTNSKIAITAALLVPLVPLLLPSNPGSGASLSGSSVSGPKASPSSLLAGTLVSPILLNEKLTGWEASYSVSGHIQRMAYGVRYNGDPKSFAVLNYQYAYDPFPQTVYDFSASFDICLSEARSKDHFYVVGIADSGEEVIERWKKAPVVPGPGGGGGGYVLKRKEIYRGALLNGIRSLGVDPDTQFLLVHHDNPARISKVMISDGQIVPVVDSLLVPEIESKCRSFLYPRDHLNGDRIWTLETMPQMGPGADRLFTLFSDYNKDGVIDNWYTETSYPYLQIFKPPGASVWADLFLGD